MKRSPVSCSVLLGEFADAAQMLRAIDALSANGYERLETFTPFDMSELDDHLQLQRSRLPWFVFACGLAGLIAAYAIQWWANVHRYPLNIGARPVNAIPAFIPSTFEGMVLCAALGAFFGLLLWLRLPNYSTSLESVDAFRRASSDKFLILLEGVHGQLSLADAARIMRDAGALHTAAAPPK